MPKRPKAPDGCFWRGGVLWGRVQIKDRDFKWTLRTDNPKDAKSRRDEKCRLLKAAIHYGDNRRTWADVMAEWADQLARNVSMRTYARYMSSMAVLQPHLQGLYLDEVDSALVTNIIKARQTTLPGNRPVTNATIKRDLGAMSSVLNFAIDQGYRDDNPVLAKMKRLKERRDPIILPDHKHIQMVVDAAEGMFADLIRAALSTGARQEELTLAKRTQLDHPRKQLTVKGKRNKLRVIDLDGWGFDDVFKPLPAALGQAWLFFDEHGNPYRWAANRFRKIVGRLAQKPEHGFRAFRFHDLRHRHAVDWLKSGRSIYDLQHRLGHTSIKTTEEYLKYLTPEEARRAKQIGA